MGWPPEYGTALASTTSAPGPPRPAAAQWHSPLLAPLRLPAALHSTCSSEATPPTGYQVASSRFATTTSPACVSASSTGKSGAPQPPLQVQPRCLDIAELLDGCFRISLCLGLCDDFSGAWLRANLPRSRSSAWLRIGLQMAWRHDGLCGWRPCSAANLQIPGASSAGDVKRCGSNKASPCSSPPASTTCSSPSASPADNADR